MLKVIGNDLFIYIEYKVNPNVYWKDLSQIVPSVGRKMSRLHFIVSVPTPTVEDKCDTSKINRDAGYGKENLGFCGDITLSMEQVLEKIVMDMKVYNPLWTIDIYHKFKELSFYVDSGKECDAVLKVLADNHIGTREHSFVSILPCTLDGSKWFPKEKSVLSSVRANQEGDTEWGKFVPTAQARIIVSQLLESVRIKATLTLDYIVFLLIAGLTAALGLVENSIVILVASMLISPMMDPIIAGMFGTVVLDRKLQKIGVLNGLVSLFMCVVVGFLFGACVELLDVYQKDHWSTEEMVSRGQLRSLWVGSMVAALSGAAIALAILSDIKESVIGVAISAALLPPAVNAGLLWSLAAVNNFYHHRTSFETLHKPVWSSDPIVEYLTLGAVSLCLTGLNILFIFFTGIIILKVKDITPKEENTTAWNPLQMVREYKPLTDEETNTLTESSPLRFGENLFSQQEIELIRRMNQFSLINKRCHQYTWSPGMAGMNRPSIQELVLRLQLDERVHLISKSIGGLRDQCLSHPIVSSSEIREEGESDVLSAPEMETSKTTKRFVVSLASTS